MKKILLIIVAFVTLSISASAADGGFYWGPKVGVGISNLSGKINSSFRGAFDAGMAIGYDSGIIGMEAAAMFKTGGASIGNDVYVDGYFISGEARLRNYYLSVPLTAKLFLTKGLFVSAGPQFDFLLGERIGNKKLTIKSSDIYNSMVISGLVGVGYQFGFGLGVAFNYNIGFTNALHDAARDVFKELKNPKNQNLSLVFSFRF